MGTRISLGKGFTYGRSGLRWGHPVPGIKKSYVSVGRSGTLLAGFHLRHWEPGRRRAAAVPTAGTDPDQGTDRLAARVAAVIWGTVIVLVIAAGLAMSSINAGYARTHDSQGQPRAPRATIDCRTDPHPEYYYACIPEGRSPAVPPVN